MTASPATTGSSKTWFRTTHWSVVVTAGCCDTARAQMALEKLCRISWRPLYAYVRRRGHSPEDAALDQVVLHALEKEPDRRYQHASEVGTDVENIATSPRPLVHAGSAAPPQGQPSPQARGSNSARTWPTTQTGGWFICFFSFFWLLVGLKKNLPVVSALGLAGVLWGATQLGLVEWWRNQLGRLMLFEYMPRYRALTLRETGRVGPLYYSYILAMNLALCATLSLFVLHRW